VVAALFRSDLSVDNEAIATKDGGYLWFDVTGIEKARDRSFEEAREEVLSQWKQDEGARLLKEKAQTVVDRLIKGEAMASLARELKIESKAVRDLAREGDASGLSRNVVVRVFEGGLQAVGSAEQGEERIVFRVTGIEVPEFIRTTKEAQTLEERLKLSMAEDLLAQQIVLKQKEFGLKIDQKALSTALGAPSAGE
jgi:peptidyl-prolyl cis-trans isomerase D